MAVPLCLPSNWTYDENGLSCNTSQRRGNLNLCERGVEMLKSVGREKIIVICVTGPARSGKSFLASRMAEGVNFEVGHTPIAKTTGIWIAKGPLITTKEGHQARLIFLDAEGANASASIDNNDSQSWDTKIFVLCFLLSSVIVYNSVRAPSASDLKMLHFISSLSNSVSSQTNSHLSKQDNAPSFFWVLRDVTLDLEATGNKTWKEFLDKHVLIQKEGSTSEHRCNNDVIKTIKHYFSSYDAEGIPVPSVKPQVCKDILNSTNCEEVAHFLTAIDKVIDKIKHNAQIKTLNGNEIDGWYLNEVLGDYVDEINSESESLPVETAWQAVLNHQARYILRTSEQIYRDSVNKLEWPCKCDDLKHQHETARNLATEQFFAKCKLNDENAIAHLKGQFDEMIDNELGEAEKRNKDKSLPFCKEVAKKLLIEDFDVLRQFNTQNDKYVTPEICKEIEKKILELYDERTLGYPPNDRVKHDLTKNLGIQIEEINMWNDVNSIFTQYRIDAEGFKYKCPCTDAEILQHNAKHYAMAGNRLKEVVEGRRDATQQQTKNKLFRLSQTIQSDLLKKNDSSSKDHCERLMHAILKRLRDRLNNPSLLHYFTKPNRKELVGEYDEKAKGPKASQVRREFIRELDKSLSEDAKSLQQLKPFQKLLGFFGTMLLRVFKPIVIGILVKGTFAASKYIVYKIPFLVGILANPRQLLQDLQNAYQLISAWWKQILICLLVSLMLIMYSISAFFQSYFGVTTAIIFFVYIVIRLRLVTT